MNVHTSTLPHEGDTSKHNPEIQVVQDDAIEDTSAESDDSAVSFLQDLLTPECKEPNPFDEETPEEFLLWLFTPKDKSFTHRIARPISTSSPALTVRYNHERSDLFDWNPENLQILFDQSIAECRGLPVEHCNYDESKVNCALQEVLAKHAYQSAFYIGATINVRRRYLGSKSRGEWMTGHRERWLSMTIVHLASGIGARRVETKLILHAKREYGSLCTNIASDSRGVSKHSPAFVYICAAPVHDKFHLPGSFSSCRRC